MRQVLRVFGSVISGVVLAAVFVFGAGLIRVQILGLRGGALFDIWSSELISVVEPQEPLLPMFAMAAWGALLTVVLVVGRESRWRTLLRGCFFAAVLILVVWGIVSAPVLSPTGELRLGVMPGWRGWLEYGSRESMVHLVMILAGALFVDAVMRARGRTLRVVKGSAEGEVASEERNPTPGTPRG